MINWNIEKRKIKDLKPHPSNPRKLSKHDAEHLQKSLEKFGLIDKPVILKDGSMIGGHQRIAVLKKMGHKEVECLVADRDMTPEEVNECAIRLNRNLGEWDWDIIANQWPSESLLEWGFTADELFLDAEQIINPEPDNEVLEPPKDPKTKLGDLYELDAHRLLCGDSTEPTTVGKVLERNIPILMTTDPPYGVEYDPEWRKKHNTRKDGTNHTALGKVQNDSQVNWALAWHLFPGSVAYVWHAGKYCSQVQKSLEEAEFEIINQVIWVKQHFALSRGDYHWQHEPCWYAVKKGHNHNWQGARDQATVWEISNLNAFGKNQDDERTAHSTQKPLECMAKPIKNNTSEGEGVYDPFAGSFTTMMACEHLGRICYSIELDPAYVDIGVQRWVNYRKKIGKEAIVKKNGQLCEDFNA
jgi:DNA modification methylase